MADDSIPDEWVHPDVRAAIDADPEIRPEAKGLMTQAVSRAVRTTGDPDVVRAAIEAAKAGDGARYLKPPEQPPVEPGSLAAIAATYKAKQGPYAPMGLGPVDDGALAQASRVAPPPLPTLAPIAPLSELASAFKARLEQYPAVGLARVATPPKTK